jgi:hypothetical protein
MIDPLRYNLQLRRRHVWRRPIRPVQIFEPRAAAWSDRMALTAAIFAVAGEQFEQLLQRAIRAVLVRKARQSIAPLPTAQRAIQTDDDIRKGRQRVRHNKEQKQNMERESSPLRSESDGFQVLRSPTPSA